MYTNPLDEIRIASPCKSDWHQMFGDDRRRFCAECKLNVYNLSGMTREEATTLLLSAEGRMCVRFFRRSDGTVLTQDCPVGWKAIKKRASRITVALASSVVAFFTGVFSLRAVEAVVSSMPMGEVAPPVFEKPVDSHVAGETERLVEREGEAVLGTREAFQGKYIQGG